jgi:hypothetical protein
VRRIVVTVVVALAAVGRISGSPAGPPTAVALSRNSCADRSGRHESERQGTARTGYPAGLVPGVLRRAAEPVARRDWALGLLRLGAISCADGALSYGVMALLGQVVLNHGPAIDEPIVGWTTKNQIGCSRTYSKRWTP